MFNLENFDFETVRHLSKSVQIVTDKENCDGVAEWKCKYNPWNVEINLKYISVETVEYIYNNMKFGMPKTADLRFANIAY